MAHLKSFVDYIGNGRFRFEEEPRHVHATREVSTSVAAQVEHIPLGALQPIECFFHIIHCGRRELFDADEADLLSVCGAHL